MSTVTDSPKIGRKGSIVVGVDGSAPSRAAIKWSMHRAAKTGVSVILAHIIADDPRGPGEPRGGSDNDFLSAELEYARTIERRVPVKAELLVGDPLEQLAAASEHMVMLAIGTHKTGFVQGRIFGSKFIQLAARAFSPVAFIPNSAARRSGGVVVGVGDPLDQRQTIEFAAREAARGSQELTIITCWQTPKHLTDSDRRDPTTSFAATLSQSVLADAETIARQAEPGIIVRTRSLHRPTAEGLVDASTAASLLIVGRSRRNASLPGSIGAIVHDVLMNLAGPAVVIHDTAPLPYTSRVTRAHGPRNCGDEQRRRNTATMLVTRDERHR